MNKLSAFSKIISNPWCLFIGKTLLYTAILLGLIYLYHYSQVGGGSFIYNQF